MHSMIINTSSKKTDINSVRYFVERDVRFTSGIELNLTLFNFFTEGEKQIIGSELIRRARFLDNLAGLIHANNALKEEALPSEWKEYKLLFPGTEIREKGAKGVLRFPILSFEKESWQLGVKTAHDKLFDNARIVLVD